MSEEQVEMESQNLSRDRLGSKSEEVEDVSQNELGFTLSDVVAKEKKILTEVPAITDAEFGEIIQGQDFLDSLFKANELVQEKPDTEAGFSIVRDLQNQKRVMSETERGEGASLNSETLSFPSFPDEQKGVLNIEAFQGQQSEVTSRDSWDAIDVMSLHFHPLETEEETGGWFSASTGDLKSASTEGGKNALKLRVKTGIPSQILRSVDVSDPELSQTPELSYLRDIKDHYSAFMMGMFAREKRPAAEKGSIDAEYRPFMVVAMSLGENKVQMLVLRDNPQRTAGKHPLPEVFKSKPFDLENHPESQQDIIEYYNASGFDAQILFVEKEEQGYRLATTK